VVTWIDNNSSSVVMTFVLKPYLYTRIEKVLILAYWPAAKNTPQAGGA